MIKAIVFDFDGLIIDTETPWYEAYKEAFGGHGVELPVEVWARCIGTSFAAFNPYDFLEECLSRPVDREAIGRQTRERHTVLMNDQEIRPGVRDYLETAKGLGLKIGLASSSSRSWVESYLSRHSLRGYFDAMRTADDVAEVKPSPELYLKAMEALGVSGEETVAFEDSLNGLKAAKAAGAYCVVVPNRVTSFMAFQNHDGRLASMADTPLEDVLASIGKKAE